MVRGMHFLVAYAAHAREDRELREFDKAIDILGYARADALFAEVAGIIAAESGTRTSRYRTAAIVCALEGVTDRFAVRGFVRTAGARSHAD